MRVPQLSDMVAVFALCVRMRRAARSLLKGVDAGTLDALNIELAAGRSELNRGPFSVLAGESRRTTREIGEAVRRIQALTDASARHALAALEQVRLYEGLRRARRGVREPANRRHAEACEETVRRRIAERMGRLEADRRAIATGTAAMAGLNRRLGVVATRVRLEAAVASANGRQLMALADRLEGTCRELDTAGRALEGLVKRLAILEQGRAVA